MASRKRHFPISEWFPIGGSNLLVRIDHNNSSAHSIFNCDTDMVTVCAGSITTSNDMYEDFKKSSVAKITYANLISDGSLVKTNDNRYIFTRAVTGKSGLMASIIVRQHVNGADSWRVDTSLLFGHGTSMSLRKFQNYSHLVGLGVTTKEREEFKLREKNIITGKDEPEFIMLLSRQITIPIFTQCRIKSYSVDALLKDLKCVIEYDEIHHFIDEWNTYTESDNIRQNIIESLGYNFFRVKQRDYIKDKKNEIERFRQHIINIGGKEFLVDR